MAGRIERSSAWDGGQDDATSTSQVEPQSILGIGRLEGHYGDPKAGFASPWPWAGAGGIRRSQRIRCTLSQSVQILRNSTQKPAVGLREPRPFHGTAEDGELLAKSDILESQLATSLEGRDESGNQRRNHAGMVLADRRLIKFGARG